MTYDFTGLNIIASDTAGLYAAELFSDELEKRTGRRPHTGKAFPNPTVTFLSCGDERLPDNDCFEILQAENAVTVYAHGIRGFIYGYSLFLRKSLYAGKNITLIKNLGGRYIPDKKIRGHQIGYRGTPNTYDAWDTAQYFRYYLDMMAFGCNICEHIPYEKGHPAPNALMRFDEEELLIEASALADKVDMDVSLWFPNNGNETEEEALERRRKLFERIPRLDVVFPPGGDPGELYADDFLVRCRKIAQELKKSHPNAKMYPSAQKPHEYPDWGCAFAEELEKLPSEIDGFIMGPNHAFPIHELRKKIPQKYPMRFYPDITHNVRCEYPVHYLLDDWHFALASCLGRESVNPRPTEYRTLHLQTRGYVIGSVSYSEGVNDDINKMVWSDMDFYGETDLRTTLLDYARCFFWDVPAEKIADGILCLEQNWQGDPAENPLIDFTLGLFVSLSEEFPSVNENWRFNLCLFRAVCDAVVRRRRLFELDLIERARFSLESGDIVKAISILKTPFSREYRKLRERLDTLGGVLFNQIGIQLDVEHYHAQNPERGAVLDTIDQPITDKTWFLNRLAYANSLPADEHSGFITRLLNRNTVEGDEFYFSMALHGFEKLNTRPKGEFYINFQGDRIKANNGQMPMCMLKLYDDYQLTARLGAFKPDTDYVLKVTFSTGNIIPVVKHHRVIANGHVIYDGRQYGGEKDEQFDREMLCPGYETAAYVLPRDVFENGTLELEIYEEHVGVHLCEFWITKKK